MQTFFTKAEVVKYCIVNFLLSRNWSLQVYLDTIVYIRLLRRSSYPY